MSRGGYPLWTWDLRRVSTHPPWTWNYDKWTACIFWNAFLLNSVFTVPTVTLLAMITQLAVQSSQLTLFIMLLYSQIHLQCLVQQTNWLIGNPYLAIIGNNVTEPFYPLGMCRVTIFGSATLHN